MRAAVAVFRTQPWAFQMITADRFADYAVALSKLLDSFELATQRVDLVADQREKDAVGLVPPQRVDRSSQFGLPELWLLEIDARKPVDLKVEKRGEHGRSLGSLTL